MKFTVQKLQSIVNQFSEREVKNYLDLLSHLSTVFETESEKAKMANQFKNYISQLPPTIAIYCVKESDSIIGSATLVYDYKIIRHFGKVAQIEDVVIDPKYQGKGYGQRLVKFLVEEAKREGSYKVTLHCQKSKIPFYEKCGFAEKSRQMSVYF